jgi:hypothetical protein
MTGGGTADRAKKHARLATAWAQGARQPALCLIGMEACVDNDLRAGAIA